MHFKFIIPLLLVNLFSLHAQAPKHQAFTALLSEHVDANGNVAYQQLKQNEPLLKNYIRLLEQSAPQNTWTKQEQMAYWINAYNAYTLLLIVNNYPLKSIRDIKEPWDQQLATIGNRTYSLNDIEHKVLREKYSDPRIHFAINCASFSCPVLARQAYEAQQLEAQLNKAATRFVNDKKRNLIQADAAQISELFKWFTDDFTQTGTLIKFLNTYSTTKIKSNASITYLPYNWQLNGD